MALSPCSEKTSSTKANRLFRESAEAIQRAIGYRGQISFNTAFEDGAPAKVLDERRFRSLFPGYSFTPHAEAIQRTVEYYQRVLSGQ